MENKKLGVLLIIIGVLMGGMFVYYSNALSERSRDLGCFSSDNCIEVERALSFSHIGIGIFSFLLALGFYLLFFSKTEKAILRKLEEDKNIKIEDEKFEWMLKALDPYERKVLKAVREQDGITQNTLRLRTDMSKAKLSYVLQDLEKRNLIKRSQKGKTKGIFLRI